MRFWLAATADAAAVVVFAGIGRVSHAEVLTLGGVAHVAWPFLTGALVGTLLSRAWRAPTRLLTGAIIWACTVAGGVALRLMSGNTAQVPFIIVACIALALLLVGWRAVCLLIHRVRGLQRTAA